MSSSTSAIALSIASLIKLHTILHTEFVELLQRNDYSGIFTGFESLHLRQILSPLLCKGFGIFSLFPMLCGVFCIAISVEQMRIFCRCVQNKLMELHTKLHTRNRITPAA